MNMKMVAGLKHLGARLHWTAQNFGTPAKRIFKKDLCDTHLQDLIIHLQDPSSSPHPT
jgi:hypothetical protein